MSSSIHGPLVIDTHVLLWTLLEPEKLMEITKKHIALAQESNQILISSISLWEIAMLYLKKRISIYEPIKDFLESIVNINGTIIKDMSPEIAAESILLADDFHGDPADRIIVATTKVHGAVLLTRDHKILSWADSGHIQFMQA
jgi:PIN domain nuclease of toxin-antitoxin system